MPTRSASPSKAIPMSAPQRGISDSQASMFGWIGSGFTPPKYGLRSVCSSRTSSVAPPNRRVNQPAPDPYIGSTRTRPGADLIRSTSTMLASCALERGEGSEGPSPPRRNGIGVVAARRELVLWVAIHGRLDGGEHLGCPCAAGVGLHLEAVVGPRIVAGSDDDARAGAHLAREEAADLGRHRVGRREGADAVRGQHFDAGSREILGGEAPVVADDNAALGGARVGEVLRHATSAAPHVVEREVLGDGGAPAIGAAL